MYTEMQYKNELCHHGIKGQKWGVRRFQKSDGSYTSAGMSRYGYDGSKGGGPRSFKGAGHRLAAKVYDINAKTYSKLGNKTLASMNAAARDQSLKKAEASDKKKQDRINSKNVDRNENKRGIRQTARSNFAKAVGQTYKVNEAVENVKAKAYGKVSDKPIIGKVASKKENTARENAKFYEKTRTDLTSGKVAAAKTKYQKFVRAMFVKNPVGRRMTINAIKTSPYLKTGQQKATALAEMGLMRNYYDEQKKLKKEGKAYNKY